MPHRLIVPEVSLATTLVAELRRSSQCLFAVAYINLEGINALADVINSRLDRATFHLRLVCAASDLITDPAALHKLLRMSRKRKGRLELRWARRHGFHSKAYGFRRNAAAHPSVILGSANLTQKAVGPSSGELCIHLSESKIAEQAWLTMERFWGDGEDITPVRLRKYAEAFERKRRSEARADIEATVWSGRFQRRRRRSLPQRPTGGEPLFVEHIVPLTKSEAAQVERARKNAWERHGLEIARGPTLYKERANAERVPPNRNILLFEWRSAQHPELGLRSVTLARLASEPIPVTDPEDDTSLWLLAFKPVRGRRLGLKRAQHGKAEAAFRKWGFTWSKLEATSGYLKGRREPLTAALRRLGLSIR